MPMEKASIMELKGYRICQDPGPVVTTILTVWYKSHLAGGGQPDALMEALKSPGRQRH